MKSWEQTSEQLPLLLIFCQSLLRFFAQFVLLITLVLQLTDLRLVKGLAGGQWETQLIDGGRKVDSLSTHTLDILMCASLLLSFKYFSV